MTHRIALQFLLAALLALSTTSPATAGDPTATDQTTAEALFQEGKRLVAAGNFAAACPKFAESQRLDPGSGTLLNLADCQERIGKLATAWAFFRDAEAGARAKGNKEREAEAARRAAALAPRLPKLAIVVPPAVRVSGFEVRRDGSLVGEAQFGLSLPLDQGAHEIVANAPGRKTFSTTVRIETEAAAVSVEVPPLEKAPDAAPAAAKGFTWGTQRILGVGLGAVGLVGIGVATGFTVRMTGLNGDSLAHCQAADTTKCDLTGVSLRNQAFDASHVATGTVIAGSALLASGVVFFLTAHEAPDKKKPDAPVARARVLPLAGPGLGGVVLQGVW
jgi:serine/threonine-protein kinase